MKKREYKLWICFIGFLVACNIIGMLSSFLLYYLVGGYDNLFWGIVSIFLIWFNIRWYKEVRSDYTCQK